MTHYAFSFDGTRCTGCKTCEMACKDYKDLDLVVGERRGEEGQRERDEGAGAHRGQGREQRQRQFGECGLHATSPPGD